MSESNTNPISGRISEEDYNFLMEFHLAGKVTVSEKLRHVCHFFRTYHEGLRRFADCLVQLQVMLQGGMKDLKDAEQAQGVRSDLLDKLLFTLPEAIAQLATFQKPAKKEDQLKALLAAEEKLLKFALSLLDALLRMGLTRSAPAYNPKLLEGRLDGILELLEIISRRK